MDTFKKVPNPGSEKAVEQGCVCPVMDNHYGEGSVRGGFWINDNCLLHGTYKKEVKDGK